MPLPGKCHNAFTIEYSTRLWPSWRLEMTIKKAFWEKIHSITSYATIFDIFLAGSFAALYKSQTREQNDTVSHHSCSFCLVVCLFFHLNLSIQCVLVCSAEGGSTIFFKEGVVSIRVQGKPWTNPFEQISANFASF